MYVCVRINFTVGVWMVLNHKTGSHGITTQHNVYMAAAYKIVNVIIQIESTHRSVFNTLLSFSLSHYRAVGYREFWILVQLAHQFSIQIDFDDNDFDRKRKKTKKRALMCACECVLCMNYRQWFGPFYIMSKWSMHEHISCCNVEFAIFLGPHFHFEIKTIMRSKRVKETLLVCA